MASLNWTMLDASRAPVPLPNETVISTIDSGASVVLDIAGDGDAPATKQKLKGDGKIWLTDQRLIFVTPAPSTATPKFESLSVPLPSIVSTAFEQPLLGNNYLKLTLKPSVDGGLTNDTTAEIRVNGQGIFSFVGALEKTRERAIYMKRQQKEELESENLPSYAAPESSGSHSIVNPINATTAASASSQSIAESSSSSQTQSSIPDENPPGYDA